MPRTSQISVQVSSETKNKLNGFLQSQGLKQNFVVEQALLFFMEAKRSLPDDAFIPPRLVLGNEGFEDLVSLLEAPPSQTTALKQLMNGD